MSSFEGRMMHHIGKLYRAMDRHYQSAGGLKDYINDHSIDPGVLKQNEKYRNIHADKRCFVIGNGPSLNRQDLSPLADEIVFTVNSLPLWEGFSRLKTDYHFFIDPSLFLNMDIGFERAFNALATLAPDAVCFLSYIGGYNYIAEKSPETKTEIAYLLPFGNIENDMIPISTDISTAITAFYTVVQAAVAAAIYMGFKEIYLLGCDCTGILSSIEITQGIDPSGSHAYLYDGETKKAMQQSVKYCQTLEDEFRGWSLIFKGYRRLLAYCEKSGVCLRNATDGGALDIVPRVRLQDIIG